MIPRKLTLEGFLSYRDRAEINFDDSPLWLLCGRNGAGKSAIFDAITFALYGMARKNEVDVQDLINHNSPDLNVEFEFIVGDQTYGIKRTASKKGGSSWQAWRVQADGKWMPLPEVDQKLKVKEWVVRTLGLDSKTFTASIMLRQGESDRLLDATPAERFAMLKQIVDLSRYEAIHARAEAKHTYHKSQADDRDRHLKRMGLTDAAAIGAEIARIEEEVTRLVEAIKEVGDRFDNADKRLSTLAGLKVHAGRWENLGREQKSLLAKAEAAKTLLERAEEIERDAARLAELKQALPWLHLFITARANWQAARKKAADARDEQDRLQGALDGLRPQIEAAVLQAKRRRKQHRPQRPRSPGPKPCASKFRSSTTDSMR